MSDDDAINEIKSGNINAFEHIYKNNYSLVSGLVYKMCPYDIDAEDYIQEIFIQANNKLYQFEHKSKFSTWLYRVAFTYILMKKRKAQSPIIPVREVVDDQMMGSSDVELLDSLARVALNPPPTLELKEAIKKLPVKYKKTFNLFFTEGYSMPEVAELTGTTLPAVKMRITKIRRILKRDL